MRFLTTSVEEVDRHTEPKVLAFDTTEQTMPSKHEEITLMVTLVGSGDTRKFTSAEIISEVLIRLAEIDHKKEALSPDDSAFIDHSDRLYDSVKETKEVCSHCYGTGKDHGDDTMKTPCPSCNGDGFTIKGGSVNPLSEHAL